MSGEAQHQGEVPSLSVTNSPSVKGGKTWDVIHREKVPLLLKA